MNKQSGDDVVTSVFLLQHSYEREDSEETKIIGIYSTKEQAEKTVEKYKVLPGFKEYSDDFYIDEYQIDKDHWEEGFIKILPKEE